MDALLARMDELPTKDISLCFALLMVAAVFLRFVQNRGPAIDHIPIFGKELGSVKARRTDFGKNGLKTLKEGYAKFKKGAFQIETTDGPRIVVGPQQMDELRVKGDDWVDNRGPIRENLAAKYTGLPESDPLVIHSIKADLTPKLVQLNEALADEVDYALDHELPPAEDWAPIKLYSKLLRIVAMASTRIFMGSDLTHDEEWLKVAIGYTINLIDGGRAVRKWRPWQRPFIYRFLPEIRKLRENKATAIKLLRPTIERRRMMEGKPGYERPNDMLQWMMDTRIEKHERDKDFEYQAEVQLNLSFAAIHTTTNAVTNMLYDLATMPECVQMLRDEIKEELGKNGGVWDGKLMKSLKKTDSFMKESQRHNPIGYTLFTRRVLKPFTLSDGTYLPKGALVIANSHMISNDPEIVGGDPWRFDPLRYYNKGLEADAGGKHQFVSLSLGSGMFGYGRHACPGRFFAGNEIKLILVKMLTNYDVKLENTTERYKNWHWEAGNNPDATKNILIKKVQA